MHVRYHVNLLRSYSCLTFSHILPNDYTSPRLSSACDDGSEKARHLVPSRWDLSRIQQSLHTPGARYWILDPQENPHQEPRDIIKQRSSVPGNPFLLVNVFPTRQYSCCIKNKTWTPLVSCVSLLSLPTINTKTDRLWQSEIADTHFSAASTERLRYQSTFMWSVQLPRPWKIADHSGLRDNTIFCTDHFNNDMHWNRFNNGETNAPCNCKSFLWLAAATCNFLIGQQVYVSVILCESR